MYLIEIFTKLHYMFLDHSRCTAHCFVLVSVVYLRWVEIASQDHWDLQYMQMNGGSVACRFLLYASIDKQKQCTVHLDDER